MSAEVAARLDPEKRYGIWWFNRRKTKTYQEAVNGAGGKTYKRRVKISSRPESEWIAVPVPDSGIPRELIDQARAAIKDNVKFSRNNRRPWELSGGLARCAECGWALSTTSVKSSGSTKMNKMNHYYRCSRVQVNYSYRACSHSKHHRADNLEPMVWEYVSGAMKDPETLRDDLDRYIELERKGHRSSGDPTREARLWAERLADVEHKRAKYQEMATEDLITFEELRARLSELDEARKTAEHELATLRGREEHVRNLERCRDALLDSLEAEAPEALDSLTPEQRHQWYRLLGLRADVRADGTVEVSWAGALESKVVCETATLSQPGVQLV
jgi:Recombinase zinc beta ribbon domain